MTELGITNQVFITQYICCRSICSTFFKLQLYLTHWLPCRFLRSLLTASKPIRRSITAAKRNTKEKKERRKKIPKNEKPWDVGHFLAQKLSQNFDFCACPSQNVIKRDASGKKAKLSWCKCIFEHIKVNLAKMQPKKHQNVQKMPFSQKAPGVNGLKKNWT